jgi:hypothetical protein
MSAIEVFARIKYNIVRNQNIRINTLRGGVFLKRKVGISLYLLLAVVVGVLCNWFFDFFLFLLYGFQFSLKFISIDIPPDIPSAILIGIIMVAVVGIYIFIGKRFIKNGRIVALALVLILVTACLYPYVMDLKSEIEEKNNQKYATTYERAKVNQINQDLIELNFNNIPDLKEATLKTLLANIYKNKTEYNSDLAVKSIIIETVKPIKINVGDSGQLVEGQVNSTPNRKIIAVLKEKNHNQEKSYQLVFKYSYDNFIYELIDIDSDGGQELLIDDEQSVQIYKYQNNNFTRIFHEDLFGDELVYFIEPDYSDIHGITTPYTYKNSYEFVPNKENPHLLDLVFKIETQPPELWGKWEKEGYDLFYEPVKDTVVFSFDGSGYVPNKEVYNYKQPKKTNTKKYTKNYTRIDYEHIPNLETDTLKNLLANLFTEQEEKHPYILINRMTIEDVKPLDIFSNGKFKKAYLIHGIIYCNLDEQYGTHLVAVLEERTDLENNKKDYKLVFNYENYKVRYELIDIDTDGGQEILIRDEGFGSPAFGPYYKDMKIYKYQEDQFLCVFDEGLYWEDYDGLGESNLGKPDYNFYQNSYKFVPNKESSHLLDIVFNIETQPQEMLKDWVKDFEPLYESVKNTVTFSFNGEKYEPNKDFYDYRNPKAKDSVKN